MGCTDSPPNVTSGSQQGSLERSEVISPDMVRLAATRLRKSNRVIDHDGAYLVSCDNVRENSLGLQRLHARTCCRQLLNLFKRHGSSSTHPSILEPVRAPRQQHTLASALGSVCCPSPAFSTHQIQRPGPGSQAKQAVCTVPRACPNSVQSGSDKKRSLLLERLFALDTVGSSAGKASP